MSKAMLKKAGAAATESLLSDLMPFLEERFRGLNSRLDSVQKDIFHLDAKVEGLQRDMLDRFERVQNQINELGIKINTVDTRLEAFIEFGRRSDSSKMESLLERLIRVEESQKPRSRKAG